MSGYAFDELDDAIEALAERLTVVPVEDSPSRSSMIAHPAGRILAETIAADRDSPAADVSAMDGYAVTSQVLCPGRKWPVLAECAAGCAPPQIDAKDWGAGVVRIFTGGVIPAGADRVIKREDTREEYEGEATVEFRDQAFEVSAGANIRRRGENVSAGTPILQPGKWLGPPMTAAAAGFGICQPKLHRIVRVAVITTGDELVSPLSSSGPQGSSLPAWQIYNSNAAALEAVFASCRYVETTICPSPTDQPGPLREAIQRAMETHDAVLLTGGVSMGDHDYVPQVVRQLGGEVVFHRLPLRPGKPILGAAADGKLLLGLPGNPVSATLNAIRFGVPLVDRIAGRCDWQRRPPGVRLHEPGDKTLPLHWLRPVRVRHDGSVELVTGKGSGDLVSLVESDGFIAMPPAARGSGPWPFYSWNLF